MSSLCRQLSRNSGNQKGHLPKYGMTKQIDGSESGEGAAFIIALPGLFQRDESGRLSPMHHRAPETDWQDRTVSRMQTTRLKA